VGWRGARGGGRVKAFALLRILQPAPKPYNAAARRRLANRRLSAGARIGYITFSGRVA